MPETNIVESVIGPARFCSCVIEGYNEIINDYNNADHVYTISDVWIDRVDFRHCRAYYGLILTNRETRIQYRVSAVYDDTEDEDNNVEVINVVQIAH